ncbi:MAG: C45 family peptidase [Acidobacteriota bacterium]
MVKNRLILKLTLIAGATLFLISYINSQDYLKGSSKFEKNGWVFLHLEGPPYNIGYQHGFLLASEIKDAIDAVSFYAEKVSKKDWKFFRNTAEKIYWPKVPEEYRQEIMGIADGMRDKGIERIKWEDILALNSWIETAWYYIPSIEKKKKVENKSFLPFGSCSAFIATGDATKDNKIVMAHNTWIDYFTGMPFNIIVDLKPEKGNRILMQSYAGFIHSGSDFYINSAGLMVTETTITGFENIDPSKTPEFVRVRKAIQYASSIDEWIKIILEDNNGGYANGWLIGDVKTGEIARLELGLKNHKIWRTNNGYYAGSNIALDDKVRQETKFNYEDSSTSPYSRYQRWEALLKENYGKIDIDLAKKYLGDHYDTFLKKEIPSARTLCGHIEEDPKGEPAWKKPPFYPEGAMDGKVADSDLARKMAIWAHWGHPCGKDFIAQKFIEEHKDFSWQKDFLKDLKAMGWVVFTIKEENIQ